MKIYSYKEDVDDFLDLGEITLVGNVAELGEIVKLLEKAISLKRNDKCKVDHVHLQDEWNGWNKNCPDIVVTVK